MDDSISQGPGRKQMAHSNWAFRGCFIKGTFYKRMGRAQQQIQWGCSSQMWWEWVPLRPTSAGPGEGGFMEHERDLSGWAIWQLLWPMATVRQKVGEEKPDLTLHHSLVSCWCLPLTKSNQKPKFKGPQREFHMYQLHGHWARWRRMGTSLEGKLTMPSTQGYVIFIIVGKVINKKQKPLAMLRAFTPAYTSLFPPRSVFWILHNHAFFRPPQYSVLPPCVPILIMSFYFPSLTYLIPHTTTRPWGLGMVFYITLQSQYLA